MSHKRHQTSILPRMLGPIWRHAESEGPPVKTPAYREERHADPMIGQTVYTYGKSGVVTGTLSPWRNRTEYGPRFVVLMDDGEIKRISSAVFWNNFGKRSRDG